MFSGPNQQFLANSAKSIALGVMWKFRNRQCRAKSWLRRVRFGHELTCGVGVEEAQASPQEVELNKFIVRRNLETLQRPRQYN